MALPDCTTPTTNHRVPVATAILTIVSVTENSKETFRQLSLHPMVLINSQWARLSQYVP